VATKVMEPIQAHYEVQDLEMGKIYSCCPGVPRVACSSRKNA